MIIMKTTKKNDFFSISSFPVKDFPFLSIQKNFSVVFYFIPCFFNKMRTQHFSPVNLLHHTRFNGVYLPYDTLKKIQNPEILNDEKKTKPINLSSSSVVIMRSASAKKILVEKMPVNKFRCMFVMLYTCIQ